MHKILRFAIFVSFHRIENYVCRSMTLHRLNKIVFIHNKFSRATCCQWWCRRRRRRRYCCQLCTTAVVFRTLFCLAFSHSIGVNKSERERRKKRNEAKREKRLRWKYVGWSDGRYGQKNLCAVRVQKLKAVRARSFKRNSDIYIYIWCIRTRRFKTTNRAADSSTCLENVRMEKAHARTLETPYPLK